MILIYYTCTAPYDFAGDLPLNTAPQDSIEHISHSTFRSVQYWKRKFPYHYIQSKYHFIIVIHLLVYSLLFLLIVFIVDYFQVFVNHFDDLVEVVTFPLSLAQGLRKANLVPQQAVDSILNSKEPQDLAQCYQTTQEMSGTCSKYRGSIQNNQKH